MKILSSFTQLHVTPNLHYLLYSVKQKKAKLVGCKSTLDSIDVHYMDTFFSPTYVLLCSTEERNSYRFERTWGWVHGELSLNE